MPKFGLSSKKKAKKAAGLSPLMAGDDDGPAASSRSAASSLSAASSRSRAEKDAERARHRKERDEKRKKRDRKLEESAAKKKKKSKPKLSQEEQDFRDSQLGCCHKFSQFVVRLIHVIDALIGLTFLVYGVVIDLHFKSPAMEAVVTSLTYGSAMLFTSIMGVIGFYTSMCQRVGLAISAYMGPLIAMFYAFVIIAMLASPDIYWEYLTDHKDVLYLTDAQILILKQIVPFFIIVLASFTAVEICRFMVLRKIRHTLVRYDNANTRISARHAKASQRSKGSQRPGGSGRSGSNRTNQTEPLLRDEEAGSSGDDSDW